MGPRSIVAMVVLACVIVGACAFIITHGRDVSTITPASPGSSMSGGG